MPGFCECPGRFTTMRKTSDFRRRPGTPWRDEISGGDASTRGSATATSAGSPRAAIRFRAALRGAARAHGGPCRPFAGRLRGGYDGRDSPRRPHPRRRRQRRQPLHAYALSRARGLRRHPDRRGRRAGDRAAGQGRVRRRPARRHDAEGRRLSGAELAEGSTAPAGPAGHHDLGAQRDEQRRALHRARCGRLPAQAFQSRCC